MLRIDDTQIVDEAHPLRPKFGEFDRHCDYLAGGKVVLMRPPERHINSSCDPNVFVKTIDGEKYVAARRLIGIGEEITYDYIIDCHGGIVWQCSCGSPKCRGTIVSSFLELPLEVQLEYLPLLNPWFVEEHKDEVEKLRKITDAGR